MFSSCAHDKKKMAFASWFNLKATAWWPPGGSREMDSASRLSIYLFIRLCLEVFVFLILNCALYIVVRRAHGGLCWCITLQPWRTHEEDGVQLGSSSAVLLLQLCRGLSVILRHVSAPRLPATVSAGDFLWGWADEEGRGRPDRRSPGRVRHYRAGRLCRTATTEAAPA